MPPRRRRDDTDTPGTRRVDKAAQSAAEIAAAADKAEQEVRAAIVEAAREVVEGRSKATFAEIGRRAGGYSREFVQRLAAEHGVKRPPTRKAD